MQFQVFDCLVVTVYEPLHHAQEMATIKLSFWLINHYFLIIQLTHVGYEMIMAIQELCASLAIYDLISDANYNSKFQCILSNAKLNFKFQWITKIIIIITLSLPNITVVALTPHVSPFLSHVSSQPKEKHYV